MVKTLGDVFVPILPAIVASGLMMGLVEALAKALPGFGATDWFAFLDMVSNTAFAYLPVIVAVSAARVFGGNIFLGAVVGLLMIHSNLTNGWNAANGYKVWYLFGHARIGDYVLGQINQLGYQGHVIPVIIAVWFMSKIEKKLHDVVPAVVDLFVTPLTTVLVTAFLTFIVIGPIFSTLETYVLQAAQVLITVGAGIGSAVMGAVYPITVVAGLHHMYNVIEAGMLRVKMLLYAETLNVIMDNLSGAMRGLGKSLVPALTTLICVCGVRIIWVFTGFQIYHTWLSLMIVFPVSWAVNATFIIIGYIITRNRMLPTE